MEDIFEDLIGILGSQIPDNNFDYPNAGINANIYVQKAITQFRKLPFEEKRKKPLLYWLLGSGTSPYKMTKKGSAYMGKPYRGQNCGNCRFIFQRCVNKELICSQIQGNIELNHWCRLWVSGDTVNPKPKK
jgi:hypothetical protein